MSAKNPFEIGQFLHEKCRIISIAKIPLITDVSMLKDPSLKQFRNEAIPRIKVNISLKPGFKKTKLKRWLVYKVGNIMIRAIEINESHIDMVVHSLFSPYMLEFHEWDAIDIDVEKSYHDSILKAKLRLEETIPKFRFNIVDVTDDKTEDEKTVIMSLVNGKIKPTTKELLDIFVKPTACSVESMNVTMRSTFVHTPPVPKKELLDEPDNYLYKLHFFLISMLKRNIRFYQILRRTLGDKPIFDRLFFHVGLNVEDQFFSSVNNDAEQTSLAKATSTLLYDIRTLDDNHKFKSILEYLVLYNVYAQAGDPEGFVKKAPQNEKKKLKTEADSKFFIAKSLFEKDMKSYSKHHSSFKSQDKISYDHWMPQTEFEIQIIEDSIAYLGYDITFSVENSPSLFQKYVTDVASTFFNSTRLGMVWSYAQEVIEGCPLHLVPVEALYHNYQKFSDPILKDLILELTITRNRWLDIVVEIFDVTKDILSCYSIPCSNPFWAVYHKRILNNGEAKLMINDSLVGFSNFNDLTNKGYAYRVVYYTDIAGHIHQIICTGNFKTIHQRKTSKEGPDYKICLLAGLPLHLAEFGHLCVGDPIVVELIGKQWFIINAFNPNQCV